MAKEELSELYNEGYYKQYESGFENKRRSDHERILKLADFKEEDNILEIGCGYGVLLSKIKSNFKKGIESNQYAVSICQKKGLDVSFDENVEKKINFPDNCFDYIIMNELIEHLHNPNAALKECYRLLKNGGKVIITTPAKNFLVRNLDKSHFSEMSIKELTNNLRNNNFKVTNIEVSGINFLDMFLRATVYKVGRKIRETNKKKNIEMSNYAQEKFDSSFLSKILSKFRKNLLFLGTQQLVIAKAKK
jgi:methionine biosynthesis protein MetW